MSETTNHVDIIEVGPRDGFQNLCSYLPAERKLCHRLFTACHSLVNSTKFTVSHSDSSRVFPSFRNKLETASLFTPQALLPRSPVSLCLWKHPSALHR